MIKLKQFVDCFVHEDGRVTNAEGVEYAKWVSPKGYVTVIVTKPDGSTRNVGRHTLVGSGYYKKPRDGKFIYVVNHINGIPGDDRADNLQWITSQENCLHGTLLGARNKRELIRCHLDGVEDPVLYWDLHDAVKQTGLSYKQVWESIRLDKPVGERQFAHIPWDYKDVLQGRLVLRTSGNNHEKRGIDRLDVATGEVRRYGSMGELAAEMGMLITHIRIRICTKENPKMLHRRYILVAKDYGFDWVTPEIVKDLQARGAKPMLAYNVATEKFVEYKSAYAFIKENNLKSFKASITKPLVAGRIKNVEGWLFCYVGESLEEAKAALMRMAYA